jgi:hypothetical protein
MSWPIAEHLAGAGCGENFGVFWRVDLSSPEHTRSPVSLFGESTGHRVHSCHRGNKVRHTVGTGRKRRNVEVDYF